jgi:hypothetical protein
MFMKAAESQAWLESVRGGLQPVEGNRGQPKSDHFRNSGGAEEANSFEEITNFNNLQFSTDKTEVAGLARFQNIP